MLHMQVRRFQHNSRQKFEMVAHWVEAVAPDCFCQRQCSFGAVWQEHLMWHCAVHCDTAGIDKHVLLCCVHCRELWAECKSDPVVTKCKHYFCERCAIK